MTRTISAQQKPSSREQKQREAREEQKSEKRRARYELEKALATRLRESSPEERKGLSIAVYDEFFQRVSSLSHPQDVFAKREGSRGLSVALPSSFSDQKYCFPRNWSRSLSYIAGRGPNCE